MFSIGDTVWVCDFLKEPSKGKICSIHIYPGRVEYEVYPSWFSIKVGRASAKCTFKTKEECITRYNELLDEKKICLT